MQNTQNGNGNIQNGNGLVFGNVKTSCSMSNLENKYNEGEFSEQAPFKQIIDKDGTINNYYGTINTFNNDINEYNGEINEYYRVKQVCLSTISEKTFYKYKIN